MKWAIILIAFLTVSLAKPLSRSRHRKLAHKCLPVPTVPAEKSKSSTPVPLATSDVGLTAINASSESPVIVKVPQALSAEALIASIAPSKASVLVEVPPVDNAEIHAYLVKPYEVPVSVEVPFVPNVSVLPALKLDYDASTPFQVPIHPSIKLITDTKTTSINPALDQKPETGALFTTATSVFELGRTNISENKSSNSDNSSKIAVETSSVSGSAEELSLTTITAVFYPETFSVTEVPSSAEHSKETVESLEVTFTSSESPTVSDLLSQQIAFEVSHSNGNSEKLPATTITSVFESETMTSSAELSEKIGESLEVTSTNSEYPLVSDISQQQTTTEVSYRNEGSEELSGTTVTYVSEPEKIVVTEVASSAELSEEIVESLEITSTSSEYSIVSDNLAQQTTTESSYQNEGSEELSGTSQTFVSGLESIALTEVPASVDLSGKNLEYFQVISASSESIIDSDLSSQQIATEASFAKESSGDLSETTIKPETIIITEVPSSAEHSKDIVESLEITFTSVETPAGLSVQEIATEGSYFNEGSEDLSGTTIVSVAEPETTIITEVFAPIESSRETIQSLEISSSSSESPIVIDIATDNSHPNEGSENVSGTTITSTVDSDSVSSTAEHSGEIKESARIISANIKCSPVPNPSPGYEISFATTLTPSIEPGLFALTEDSYVGRIVNQLSKTTEASTSKFKVSDNVHEQDISSEIVAPLTSLETFLSEQPNDDKVGSADAFTTSEKAGEIDNSAIISTVYSNISVESQPVFSEPSSNEGSIKSLVKPKLSSLSNTPSRKTDITSKTSVIPQKINEPSENNSFGTLLSKPRAPLRRFLSFTVFNRDGKNTSLKHFLDYLRSLRK